MGRPCSPHHGRCPSHQRARFLVRSSGEMGPGPEASAMRQNFWWHGGEELDELVRQKYTDLLQDVVTNAELDTVARALRGAASREAAVGVLARVIVLSQFSRHILPRGP